MRLTTCNAAAGILVPNERMTVRSDTNDEMKEMIPTGSEDGSSAELVDHFIVLWRDDTPYDDQDIGAFHPLQFLDELRHERAVGGG